MRELLFLDDLAGSCEDVAAAEEYGARNTAIERLQESELALFEGEFQIAAAKLDTIGGIDFVCGRGIDTEGIQLFIDFAGRFLRRPDLQRNQEITETEENDAEPHDRV